MTARKPARSAKKRSTSPKRRPAVRRNSSSTVKKYGAVPVETIVLGRGNAADYVWVGQKIRGSAAVERKCPVVRITPRHVIIETLHTGIVVRSVPADQWGYREVKIDRVTGDFVDVTENLRVLDP